MPDDPDPDVERVAQAIAAHLERHPMAADNEHGIAHWWLPALGVDMPLTKVVRALERLERSGRVTRSVLPDGRAIYRANPAGQALPHIRRA